MKWYYWALVIFIAVIGAYFLGSAQNSPFLGSQSYTSGSSNTPAQTSTGPASSQTSSSGTSQKPVVTVYTVSSPAGGERYCDGDIIPVRWSLPIATVSYRVAVDGPGYSQWITSGPGSINQAGPTVEYAYYWNQQLQSGAASIPLGSSYYIAVVGTKKDGSTVHLKSNGTFSIANCHSS